MGLVTFSERDVRSRSRKIDWSRNKAGIRNDGFRPSARRNTSISRELVNKLDWIWIENDGKVRKIIMYPWQLKVHQDIAHTANAIANHDQRIQFSGGMKGRFQMQHGSKFKPLELFRSTSEAAVAFGPWLLVRMPSTE
jgi:hypothetical protein